jgi:hypothetical protein
MNCQAWPALRAFLVLPLQVLEGIVRLPIALHDALVAIEHKNLAETTALQQQTHAYQAELLASHAVVVSTLWNLSSEFREDARRIAGTIVARYPKVAPAPARSLLDQIKKP